MIEPLKRANYTHIAINTKSTLVVLQGRLPPLLPGNLERVQTLIKIKGEEFASVPDEKGNKS